jgi:hypothetical protein
MRLSPEVLHALLDDELDARDKHRVARLSHEGAAIEAAENADRAEACTA